MQGVTRAGIGGAAWAAALACAGLPLACLTALAEGPGQSLVAAGHAPDLTRHLRMSQGVTGATVTYFAQVMTGGQECTPTPNGTVECLSWDGFFSAFDVAYEGVTETDEMELKKGVLAAVAVACPSAKARERDPAEVERIAPGLYRLGGACPAVDAATGGN